MKPKILRSEQNLIEASLGAFATGSAVLWGSLLLVTTFLFLLKIPLSGFHLIFSALISLVFLFWYTSKTSKNSFSSFIIALGVFIATFTPALIISGSVIDISYDGQAYHQEAVIQLSRGWNPVYMMLDGQATANLERWLNSYPKGVWYFAASLYDLTGNIESGKVLSLFAPAIALAFGIWGTWRLSVNKYLKTLAVFILVFNPVTIYQSLSYYLDGVLVSMLLSLAFVGVRIANTKDRSALWPFLFLTIILLNIKLSSVIFTGILLFGIVMYFWTNDRLRMSLRTLKFTILGVVLGFLIVGYSPYVTNFVTQGHPLYPSMGKNAYDYVPGNAPENYWHLIPPARLLQSIFSYTSLARGEGQYGKSKMPFVISSEEFEALRQTNAKTGGFGPLFGAVFLISAVAGFCYAVFAPKNKKRYTYAMAMAAIIGSAALVDTSSVARYVPYVWWVGGILLLYLFSEKKILPKIVGGVIAILMIVNIAITGVSYYPYNFAQSIEVQKRLQAISQSRKEEPIVIDVAQFGSTKIKLKEYGIAYIEVPAGTDCKTRSRLLPHNITEMCEL